MEGKKQVAAIVRRGPFYREGVLRYGEATGQNKTLALVGERGLADDFVMDRAGETPPG